VNELISSILVLPYRTDAYLIQDALLDAIYQQRRGKSLSLIQNMTDE
jgi:hypothetical protein